MKIAIMGAGFSGLTCALTLEKHGYSADIFEKRGMVGDRMVYAEGISSIFHTPIKDYIQFLSENYDLHLKPTSNISRTHIYSKNESATLDGNLGFINMRGKHPDSYEKQLAEKIKSPIHFNAEVNYEEISKEYTHVILATGDPMDVQEIQPFEISYKASFRGSTVSGEFKRNEIYTWFNNDFAPKGMSYLLPHSETEASLIVVYPQYPENQKKDKEELWEQCLESAQKSLQQKLSITNDYSLKDFMVGKAAYPRIGNTFFTGNCLGCISPFIGFGQFTALLTGIYAAEDICGLESYEKQTKSIYQKYHDSLTLRRLIEHSSNEQLDRVVKSLHNELLGKALTSPKLQILKVLAKVAHPIPRRT
ncbi:NAD(P)/FAD-dependent oxidoreductase [Halobacillus mangrovi]|uniref:FAD-dependent oxidoreductase n=1 Tax=Halobacillus mangrovi TaxID=402384 RepID=A0A1W6A0J0_9BACI|nr:NAD(P)-binding protein [Halobacillus mangrovi]ARI79017.1 FAD-dependent oxidoreductase [Halobacillus mangrovi]